MPRKSAGILMFRRVAGKPEFLLAHPGGPFYRNKDAGSWSIPKGEYEPEEDPQAAALREFQEEIGIMPGGTLIALNPIIQKAGKEVRAWAVEGDFKPEDLVSNTFSMQWPPNSGKFQEFPEVDRVEWFDLEIAKVRINPAQVALLEELSDYLALE